METGDSYQDHLTPFGLSVMANNKISEKSCFFPHQFGTADTQNSSNAQNTHEPQLFGGAESKALRQMMNSFKINLKLYNNLIYIDCIIRI